MTLDISKRAIVKLRTWKMDIKCSRCKASCGNNWKFIAKNWDKKWYYDVRYYCTKCYEQFKKEFM